ncbi:MAG: diaminopimelate epimerase [Phycisphaerales bacterium]|nr:diaminopimelate epimerase [Phycisphaerales bacterium]
MSLPFVKMHGLGNDYVYVVTDNDALLDTAPRLAQRISDRHRGVGSDGLILILPATRPDADARMVMYNADGSRAQMCGNGVRCVGKLVWDDDIARRNPLRIETDAGVLSLDLRLGSENRVEAVRVDMGPAIFEADRIPIDANRLKNTAPGGPLIRVGLVGGPADDLAFTCLSMGNPHAVCFVDDLQSVPLTDWGPWIERHAAFPARVNIHFARVDSPARIEMMTWERGSGVTQACGTGACAVAVAGVLEDRTERAVTTVLPGGELKIEWDRDENRVYMTGPATEVFRGVWPEGA